MYVLNLNAFYFVCAVMLMGTLVYGIKYTLPEYLCTFLVAGGVSTFALLKVFSVSNLPTSRSLCVLCLKFC